MYSISLFLEIFSIRHAKSLNQSILIWLKIGDPHSNWPCCLFELKSRDLYLVKNKILGVKPMYAWLFSIEWFDNLWMITWSSKCFLKRKNRTCWHRFCFVAIRQQLVNTNMSIIQRLFTNGVQFWRLYIEF
jgi:hypothetical protein